jgi:hypothetical protein
MADIAIIIPVLNRPHRASLVCESIFANTEVEVELYFVCSPGDHAEYDACANTGEEIILVPWEAGPGDFAKKQNLAYTYTTAPYILLGADDLDFEIGWDVRALAVAERTRAGVIGTNDDANPLVKKGRHATHPIVARDYIETIGGTWHDGPGIVYHEGYGHQYVDTELCGAAIERGEWAFAHTSVVRHLHPMYPHRGIGRTPMDDTYRKALGDAHADKMIFVERQERAKAQRLGHAL